MLNWIKQISPLSVFVFEILIITFCALCFPLTASLDEKHKAEYVKEWKCPYCYHHWQYGEKCQNPECPTNNW